MDESELVRKFFATAFPNPDRVGCPDRNALWAIARNTLPADDPARVHLASCSPCFVEFQELKNQLHKEAARRTKRVIAAAAAAIVVGAIAGSILWTLSDQRASPEPVAKAPAAKTVRPNEMPDKRQGAKSSNGKPYELAFDLRPLSPTRGEDKGKALLFRVPARLLRLRLTLPFGSDDGVYDLEVRRSVGSEALKATKGNATIRNGDTRIDVELDLSGVPVGKYVLLYRHADASWHDVPIVVTD